MPATKKNTERKLNPAKWLKKSNNKSPRYSTTTLFPDQLSKVNTLLEKAILLPR